MPCGRAHRNAVTAWGSAKTKARPACFARSAFRGHRRRSRARACAPAARPANCHSSNPPCRAWRPGQHRADQAVPARARSIATVPQVRASCPTSTARPKACTTALAVLPPGPAAGAAAGRSATFSTAVAVCGCAGSAQITPARLIADKPAQALLHHAKPGTPRHTAPRTDRGRAWGLPTYNPGKFARCAGGTAGAPRGAFAQGRGGGGGR